MSVLCEALSVLVRAATLDEKYPGGLEAYRAGVPNRTWCSDGKLTRVGFMRPEDVLTYLGVLRARSGLVTDLNGRWIDVVVVDQFTGPTAPCNWVKFERHAKYSHAWRLGFPPGPLAKPEHWVPGELRFHNDESSLILEDDPTTPGVHTTVDVRTGDVTYLPTVFDGSGVAQGDIEGALYDALKAAAANRDLASAHRVLLVVDHHLRVWPVAVLRSTGTPAAAVMDLARGLRRRQRGRKRRLELSDPISVAILTKIGATDPQGPSRSLPPQLRPSATPAYRSLVATLPDGGPLHAVVDESSNLIGVGRDLHGHNVDAFEALLELHHLLRD
jgi:hypothetical protein